MAERIDRDELRALIREALKEALGEAAVPPTSLATGEGDHAEHGGGGSNKRSVRHSPPPPPSAVPLPRSAGEERAARSGEYRLTSGVLNESKVAELGRTHSKIIIGTDVAVTPLARDRAREIKIEIVRQKP
jgi:hypothetical protein